MAQIYKQFDAGVIKILLLFPIWNLKAILTKYNFSSQMTKEQKNPQRKGLYLEKEHYYGLDPQETLARGKLEL